MRFYVVIKYFFNIQIYATMLKYLFFNLHVYNIYIFNDNVQMQFIHTYNKLCILIHYRKRGHTSWTEQLSWQVRQPTLIRNWTENYSCNLHHRNVPQTGIDYLPRWTSISASQPLFMYLTVVTRVQREAAVTFRIPISLKLSHFAMKSRLKSEIMYGSFTSLFAEDFSSDRTTIWW